MQVDKFVGVKGLSFDLISGCREVIRIRDTVIRLMKKCEGIASTMQKVVSDLIHSHTQLDDSNQITKQPRLLNERSAIICAKFRSDDHYNPCIVL